MMKNLEQMARDQGAGYFGVADLSSAREFIREQGGELPASFPRALSVGVILPLGLVKPLVSETQDIGAFITYDRYVYQVLNLMLDTITSGLAVEIEKNGYRAMPVAASLRVPGNGIRGVFSHKLAAHLAGMGWIGKNCLLITPKDGPRVRWGTVLTDAPLIPGEPLDRGCGKCNRCVEACPAGAVKGRSFNHHEPRSERLDVDKCNDYRIKLEETSGYRACGKCLAACPFGRKNKK